MRYRALIVPLFAALLAPAAAPPASALRWENDSVDKTAEVGAGEVRVVFAFTNTGTVPVVIQRVETSCGCTSAKLAKTTYAPAETGAIQVTIKPGHRPGKFSRKLTVLTDEEQGATSVLTVKLTVSERPATRPATVPSTQQ